MCLKRRRNRLVRNGTLGRLAVVAVAHIDAVRGRGHGEAQNAAVHLHHFVLLHFLVFALQTEERKNGLEGSHSRHDDHKMWQKRRIFHKKSRDVNLKRSR